MFAQSLSEWTVINGLNPFNRNSRFCEFPMRNVNGNSSKKLIVLLPQYYL